MVKYKLLNVPHISRFDTWRFTSLQEQTQYFNGISGTTINDYFPPFFTNYLKLDKSDLSSNIHYNYCILDFEEKYYYYFITDLKYINESVIGINLVMDTIQTFMFDIKFNYSVLSRMSIKRMLNSTGNSINRDYIRENLSKGEFLVNHYSENNNHNYVIVTCRQPIGNPIDTARGLVQEGFNFTNGLYRYLIILPKIPQTVLVTQITLRVYTDSSHYSDYSFSLNSIASCFNSLLQHSNVIDCVWVSNSNYIDSKLNPRQSYYIETHTLMYSINNFAGSGLGLDFENVLTPQDNVSYRFAPILTITNNDFTTSYFDITYNGQSFSGSRNHSKITLFNPIYVPALLDENYIQVKYGEKMKYSTFPLYKSHTTRFLKYDYYDFASFSRLYGINFDEYEDFQLQDIYNSKIICNTLENLDLYTDAWQTYKSQNYATLKSGIKNNFALASAGILLGGANAQTSASGNSSVGTSASNPMFWGSTYGGNKNFRMDNPRILGAKVGLAGAKTLNDYLVTKGNLEHTPDTRNQGNQYSSDVLGKFNNIFTEIDCVSDIEAVAKKLEYFGYKVHKVLTNENLLNNGTLLPRYYYNIVQCDELTLDVDYYIQDQDIIDDIEARFKEGLRLWNKESNTNMLDTLIYDNIENDFIVEE